MKDIIRTSLLLFVISVSSSCKDNIEINVNLSALSSKKIIGKPYVELKTFDKVGEKDSLKIARNLYIALDAKIILESQNDYESNIVLSDLTIKFNNKSIFKRDSILTVGIIEYNKKNDLLILPIIKSQNPDDFKTNSDLILFNLRTKQEHVLKESLTDCSTAFFSINGESIFYLNSGDLIKLNYLNGSESRVIHFEENEYQIMFISIIDDSRIKIIYIKDMASGELYESEVGIEKNILN